MKLDKIKFAVLVAFIVEEARNGFDDDAIAKLDNMIDIEAPIAPAIYANDLHTLMALMQEGTRKIDAIKLYRAMTGYGLKESKDIVEKYWPDAIPKLSRTELFARLKVAGINNDTEYHDIERFIEDCFK